MDRRNTRDTDRKRLALAIGASIGIHALLLTGVRIDVPAFEGQEPERPLRWVELPDDPPTPALEVIPLESARRVADARESAGPPEASPSAPAATAPAPAIEAALPGAPPRPATTFRSLDLKPAAETAATTPAIEAARPARGLLLRADAGEAVHTGLDFYAASDAARAAEGDEQGDGRSGRGIGISISGPGHCPTGGGIPIIGVGGGLGEVPVTGNGMGIIGARPPNQGAINRFGPKIGGGR